MSRQHVFHFYAVGVRVTLLVERKGDCFFSALMKQLNQMIEQKGAPKRSSQFIENADRCSAVM
jgi:hypothetical protein